MRKYYDKSELINEDYERGYRDGYDSMIYELNEEKNKKPSKQEIMSILGISSKDLSVGGAVFSKLEAKGYSSSELAKFGIKNNPWNPLTFNGEEVLVSKGFTKLGKDSEKSSSSREEKQWQRKVGIYFNKNTNEVGIVYRSYEKFAEGITGANRINKAFIIDLDVIRNDF